MQDEGFSGLGLAFIFAGARALIVSHWYMDIEATMLLSEAIMNKLAQVDGTTISEALKQAMVDLAKDPRFSAPALWGGFVVVGDGRSGTERAMEIGSKNAK